MGCDSRGVLLHSLFICFNPRTRMGCDKNRIEDCRVNFVSIHAPAWGATWSAEVWATIVTVSIHAPAWGATFVKRKPCNVGQFQSTHPHGVRHRSFNQDILQLKFQSTHPHGVRHRLVVHHSSQHCFNPRTRMGCDEPCGAGVGTDGLFQSTHPHGVRPSSVLGGTYLKCVSIHAPAWGATLLSACHNRRQSVSIHAPAWGATKSSTKGFAGIPVSIHAPAWGATVYSAMS